MAYTNNLIPILMSNSSDGIASASSEFNTTYSAWKALDKDSATYWATTTAGVLPCYLRYMFKNPSFAIAATKYTITARVDSILTPPRDWIFQGSNDGSTWTDIDTQVDISFSAGEKKEYTFVNTTVYMYYQIYITDNNGGTTTNIAEFEIMATVINNVQVAGIDLQVEIEGTAIQVAGIDLQVEVLENSPENVFRFDLLKAYKKYEP